MIVCVCNNISNKDIIKYININKTNNFKDVSENLSCCNQCEVCKYDIQDILDQYNKEAYKCPYLKN